MATETLNVSTVATKNSWTGTDSDIYEAIASADGNGLANAIGEGDALLVNLDDPVNSDLTDAATVTRVDVNLRAMRGANANDDLTVQVYIGGAAQGVAVAHGNLANGTMQNSGNLNDAGWNSDWTLAQLQGMQIEIIPTQGGMPENVDVTVDCLDVIVTYTPAATGRRRVIVA